MERLIAELAKRRKVLAAREWLECHDDATIALQRQLAVIPAPTGAEERRGAFVAARFGDLGLAEVRTDGAGNVLGRLGPADGAGVVIASHLDTVFPAGTKLEVREAGARLIAPGIGDNARGLAAMLAIVESCRSSNLEPPRPITFVATVGEEGAGDLRGAKHLFEDPAFKPDAFIALDGAGINRIAHRALGSRRLRATFKGPGGHSWAAFGVANAAHAVGAATTNIAGIALPASPRTTASVVRIGGGSSLNTIPQEAWLELDLRSEAEASLEALYGAVSQALGKALEAVNRKRSAGTAPLTLHLEPLGNRPSGVTNEKHALVRAAVAATRAVGQKPELAAASTDANVPISRGIPGIALGAGGRGGEAHLESEWYENVNGPAGIFRALLTVLAVVEHGAARAPGAA